jgi:hypothetical protein
MDSYERELQSPVRNLLVGQLTRSLLIQVQHGLGLSCSHLCATCWCWERDAASSTRLRPFVGTPQVQRLKLDTEAAMLELDQILKANVSGMDHVCVRVRV